jgi:hypothetical protein
MQDGENILREFLLGAVVRLSENHDFPAVTLALDEPFDEFETEPGESVAVGNHKAEFISAM